MTKANGAVERDRNWVVVLAGQGAVVGRLSGSTEDDVRREMSEGRIPTATLSPCVVVSPHLVPTRNGIDTVLSIDCLEQSLKLSVEAEAPLYVILTAFYFVSEFDSDSRKKLMQWVEDTERRRRSLRSGIVAV